MATWNQPSTPAHDPRCSCCPLLVGEHADARDRVDEPTARSLFEPPPRR